MTNVRILSIGRAVPERSFTQQDLLQHSPWSPSPLLDRLFLDSPIQQRGFMIPPDYFLDAGRTVARTLSQNNAAWLDAAMALGGSALDDALERADTRPEHLDFIGVTTVTGYATPGLDLLLARDHGLRNDIRRAHFNCIGCHAALPLLAVAADHVRHRPDDRAVALAVEVCSAAFRYEETAQNQVATSLFADGAAAVVLGTSGDGPVVLGTGSRYDFEHMDALGFELDHLGFSIVLDPSIPSIIAQHVEAAVLALLEQHGQSVDDVTCWAFHPGGSKILDAVQSALQLEDADMTASRRVLRGHGNMSSPTVLFSLVESFRSRGVPTSGVGVLAAFGPGLGIEVALIGFGR